MRLFEEYKIGSMELRNRLVMAPMSTNLIENGYVTQRMVCFYEERAKGGVGLITIGDGIVDYPIGNNVLESIGIIKGKVKFLGLEIQPEDFFMNYAQDNFDGDFPNRNLHTWEGIAKWVKLNVAYLRNPTFAHIVAEMKSGNGVMALFPGHYVAIGQYDGDTKELIYHNSWNGDPRNRNGGKNETMTEAEYNKIGVSRALAIWV